MTSVSYNSTDPYNRNRSERASSLALPNNSLLDCYDKAQEECNSIALLPSNINGIVVRRHSSHCYPSLESTQQQQQQRQEEQQSSYQRQLSKLSHIQQSCNGFPNYQESQPQQHQKYHHSLLQQQSQSLSDTQPLAVTSNSVQMATTGCTNQNHRLDSQNKCSDSLPPPVPKRTLRSNTEWLAEQSGISKKKNNKSEHQANKTTVNIEQIQRNPTNQCQQHQRTGENLSYNLSPIVKVSFASSCLSMYNQNPYKVHTTANPADMFVDVPPQNHPHEDQKSIDVGQISNEDDDDEDDGMSLENSVFEESIPSPKTRTTLNDKDAAATKETENNFTQNSMQMRIKYPNRSAVVNDLCMQQHYQLASTRRANRSSTDSTKSQTTIDTGYISSSNGSDRYLMNFRSRFSSDDTQSSLDSCLTDKTIESPLSKESFKIGEPPTITEIMADDYNDIKRNNIIKMLNNSGSIKFTNSNNKNDKILPAVPLRKQQHSYSKNPPIVSPRQQQPGGSSIDMNHYSNKNIPIHSTNSPSIPPAPPSRFCTKSNHSSNNKQPRIGTIATTNIIKQPASSIITVRNKLNKPRPPPIVYPKLHERQDSNLSNDSFSMTSSPGYNSKNLIEEPLLQSAAQINKTNNLKHQDSNDSMRCHFVPMTKTTTINNNRQDSGISSDSVSQTSSPGYNSKLMEAPLLPSTKRFYNAQIPILEKQRLHNDTIEELEQPIPTSPIIKSISTPASLQAIVRFQNGSSNMSFQHRIVKQRKSSNPYVTNGRLKFRLFQILVNAFALLAIAGGLATYFHAYPTIKIVNKTIINTVRVEEVSAYGKNPAPGTCLPIIVRFCQGPQIPYNYTVFPNYIGHLGQLEAQADIEAYESLVDVRCYELASLFVCTLFIPKCGTPAVPPCKALCTETMRRCGFFFDVFGLTLPEYLNCNLFKDSENSDECVGLKEVRNVMIAARNPVCDGFRCDHTRCISKDYVCDGHLDCMDQMDEAACEKCDEDSIYCGENRCISTKHMCDGIVDCPYGQDERNCIRLSDRNGDLGKGVLEVFRINTHEWTPACVKNWDRSVSPTAICSILGYSSVNATSIVTQRTRRPLLASVNVSTDIWKMYTKKRSNLMKEFESCSPEEDYPIAELTCTNYECGKVRRQRHKPTRRIIGGTAAKPGDWPFLAAILGGPEKIFYCAGVLISDQWVLTASHCIGNHTVIDLEDWTIQLGVTRRNSFTYSGQMVKVKKVIPHPLYNMHFVNDNDIALFKLASRVSFQEHLSPVCLPPPTLKQLKPGELCTVIGWGKRHDTYPKATYEPIINEVQVPIIRRQQCSEWMENYTISDGMICAGYEEGGKDACQGDSGGPLLCQYPGEKNKWFVGGVVSWGIKCADPKLPGVYTNVIKFVPWILEQIQKNSNQHRTNNNHQINRNNDNTNDNNNRHLNIFGNRSPSDLNYLRNYKKNP